MRCRGYADCTAYEREHGCAECLPQRRGGVDIIDLIGLGKTSPRCLSLGDAMSRSYKSRRGADHNPKNCPWCISNRTHRHVKQAVFAPDADPDEGDTRVDEIEYEIWLATGLYSDELFAAWKQKGMDRWSPALLSEARKPLRPLGQ